MNLNSSLEHQTFSNEAESSVEYQPSQQFSTDTADFHNYHLMNMHNFEKFVNPHDIAGQEGIVKTQKDELENKKVPHRILMCYLIWLKVQFRFSNEIYLRRHPEINDLINVFLFKILDDKPEDVLSYAGKFFDK